MPIPGSHPRFRLSPERRPEFTAFRSPLPASCFPLTAHRFPNENGRRSARSRIDLASRSSLGGDDHLDPGVHVAVQRDLDLELADVADRAVGHDDFGLVDRLAVTGERLGNVTRADRAEQLAL